MKNEEQTKKTPLLMINSGLSKIALFRKYQSETAAYDTYRLEFSSDGEQCIDGLGFNEAIIRVLSLIGDIAESIDEDGDTMFQASEFLAMAGVYSASNSNMIESLNTVLKTDANEKEKFLIKRNEK